MSPPQGQGPAHRLAQRGRLLDGQKRGHFSVAMLVWEEVEALGPTIGLGRSPRHPRRTLDTPDGLTQGNLRDVPVPQSLQVSSFQTTLSLLFLESAPCSCHRDLQTTPAVVGSILQTGTLRLSEQKTMSKATQKADGPASI